MKIKASELKFGDVIRRNAGFGEENLVMAFRHSNEENAVTFIRDKSKLSIGHAVYIAFVLQDNEEIEIMRPMDMTPAQLHVGLLVDAVKSAAGINAPYSVDYYRSLIAKIEPPKPVTVSEVLALLHDVAQYPSVPPEMTAKIGALISRHRKENNRV